MASSGPSSPFPQEILDWYTQTYNEGERLARGLGLVERIRIRELLLRALPVPPAVVYDIGGGTGVRPDSIRVVVGADTGTISAAEVADRLAAAIRVRPEVALTSPEDVARVTTQEGKRKPVSFFDFRSNLGQNEG